MEFLRVLTPAFLSLRNWAQHHGGEAVWAAAFAVLFGLPLAVLAAMLFLDPPSYTVYFVAQKHHLMDSKDEVENAVEFKDLRLRGSHVRLVLKELQDESSDSALKMANALIKEPDTLMVISHQDSGPTEAALSTYMKQRPQVPYIASIQTDDNLLRKACKEQADCYDGLNPLPYLQLSPTNEEQAHWALQFAAQNKKEHFLIIESSDAENQPYSDSLALDYEKAIGELVQKDRNIRKYGPKKDLTKEQLAEQLHENEIDCVLYAGAFDDAVLLLKELVEIEQRTKKNVANAKALMVILDDDVVEERLKWAQFKLTGVNITDSSDEEDYEKNLSAPGYDAIAIAAQMIRDLDSRRDTFDFQYRIKSIFRQESGADARRALVRTMQDNFRYRSAYLGSFATALAGKRAVYAFDDNHRRANGLFHVWERTGFAMIDVDRWHPPRAFVGRPVQPELKASN